MKVDFHANVSAREGVPELRLQVYQNLKLFSKEYSSLTAHSSMVRPPVTSNFFDAVSPAVQLKMACISTCGSRLRGRS